MSFLLLLLLFPFITIPSLIYGISGYILLPVGLLLRLLTGKPSGIRASIIAIKLNPIFLLFGVPLIFYFYVWKPLAWIFFAWMTIYFVSRRFTGASQKKTQIMQGWEEADAIMRKLNDSSDSKEQ